jgi:tetratricopeptide (TPR) repeat protein
LFKKKIIEYINGLKKNTYLSKLLKVLKENKLISKYSKKIMENKYIARCLKKIKENKYIARCLSKLKQKKYLVPTVIILLLIICAGITTIVRFADSRKTAETLSIATNVAETDFYEANYDQAIAEYTKMQEKQKDEWPIWNVKIAEIYSVEGEFVKSNDMLEKAYEARNKIMDDKKKKIDNLQEKDEELGNYITFTWLMNGEYEKAQEYGEMFLQAYPDDKALLKTMFDVYLVNGNNDKAKEMISDYQNSDGTASDLTTLARMNMLVNNYDECFSLLKDAWNKDKNDIRVLDVVEQIADYDKNGALDKISELQKKEPNELAYKMWTAKIYSMSKDSADKAKKLIDELNSEDVGDISLNLIKANMYSNLNDKDDLNKVLNEIVSSNSNSIVGDHAAALLAYNNEDYDTAFKDCEKSIILDRDYSDNYTYLLPEILEKQDKSKEAEAYFRTALFKEPINYDLMLKTAEYYGNTLKDSTKALSYYNLASKINPKDAETYYNMALVKANIQRYDDAIDLLKKSITINSKSAKYHRALGTAYINKGKNDEGIKEIRTAYSLDNKDIKTLNNAGCYYISVEGDVSRGMTNLKAAYDGINENTSAEDKETITENYNRIKDLSDAYNKRNGASLKVPDLKLFY